MSPVPGPAHKLEITTVRSTFTEESFQVYCKYQVPRLARLQYSGRLKDSRLFHSSHVATQMAIHKDKPEKLTEERYIDFLVESPLEVLLRQSTRRLLQRQSHNRNHSPGR